MNEGFENGVYYRDGIPGETVTVKGISWKAIECDRSTEDLDRGMCLECDARGTDSCIPLPNCENVYWKEV